MAIPTLIRSARNTPVGFTFQVTETNLSATGTSGFVTLPYISKSAVVTVSATTTSVPTGTSPTLAVAVQDSVDGVNSQALSAAAGVTASNSAATTVRTAAGGVAVTGMQNVVRLAYTVGGTTPVYPSVTFTVTVQNS